MASFYDYTSSNGYTSLYLQTDYTTTAYVGYTRVAATSYVVVKAGSWDFTTYKNSTNPKISINGSTANLTQYEVKVGTSGNKYKVASNYVDISHTTNKTITIESSIDLSSVKITSTGGKVGSYSASEDVILVPKSTACTAPTTFTATGVNGFDTSVKLTWSGAKSGTANAIQKYQIRYRKRATSSDDWGSWTDLEIVESTETSGSKEFKMSDYIERKHYVQFAIRTLGSAGSSYYSDWEFSSTLRRKYFTKCIAPTSFALSSNPFDKNVTLTWSGAGNGTNNTISSYHIQYNTSVNNSTWDGWKDLISISSTSASGNKTIDMSSKVSAGCYVKFQIRTQGNASGDKIKTSDYYSGYKTSSTIKRISRCVNPTSLSATPNPFDSSVKISWSGAKGVTNNTINSYYIQYCTSTDNSTWGSWAGLKTVKSTATSDNVTIDLSSKVDRGKYVKFQIRTQGSAGSTYYPTSYKGMSSGIQRITYTNCVAPTKFTASPSPFEDSVTLNWSGADNGVNNNIFSYQIEYRVSSDNKTWGEWEIIVVKATSDKASNTTINMLSKNIKRGQYVQFRIKTCGDVSGYDSEYISSSSVQRNLYSKCTPPTNIILQSNGVIDTSKTFNYIFNDKINISWTSGQSGDNVNITSYYIQYQISNSANTWGSTWSDLTSLTTTSIQVNPTLVQRGQYIRFRIQTRCSNSNYNSDYSDPTYAVKRVGIPSDVSAITISPSEFSSGDDVNVSWGYYSNDYGTNYESPIDMYKIYGRYLDKDANPSSDWSIYTILHIPSGLVNGTNISINLTKELTNFYNNIENETYAEIAIIPYDAFGNVGAKNIDTCAKARVFRYDRSGVSIGINGKWIPCQIYYGVDGAWIQCDVSAGVESSWKQCSG